MIKSSSTSGAISTERVKATRSLLHIYALLTVQFTLNKCNYICEYCLYFINVFYIFQLFHAEKAKFITQLVRKAQKYIDIYSLLNFEW